MGTIECTRREFEAGISVPLDERTTIIVGPDAIIATMRGRAFDPNKSFILPRAKSVLADIFRFASAQKATAAVVVGHTNVADSEGETLSRERAEMAMAWFDGQPDRWLANYQSSVAEQRRWGAREDRLILSSIPDLALVGKGAGPSGPSSHQDRLRDPLVQAYQQQRGLTVDGIAGPETRKALIKDYFRLTRGPSVREAAANEAQEQRDSTEMDNLGMQLAAHGAGSNFPIERVELARRSDAAQPDAVKQGAQAKGSHDDDPVDDARIDFVFFKGKSGAEPVPGAADGPEYMDWVELAGLHRNFEVAPVGGGRGSKLSIKLFDRTGAVRHAGRPYQITGPEDFSGVTDDSGGLRHDDVPPGDYTLRLLLEFFEGEDKITEELVTPIVVTAEDDAPLVRLIGAVPQCRMARLRGLLFDTNKAFLLPTAMEDLKKIRSIYEQNNPSELLIVGHTDTTAGASVNDPLSLERAKATLAFLQDDVDAWQAFYGGGVPQSRRWGENEDRQMLGAVLALDRPIEAQDLLDFQRHEGITENGFGQETRRAIITRYMRLDGAELDSGQLDIKGSAHGCGENFPVDDTGDSLDQTVVDAKEDELDRRVELFFFDAEFGVAPAPRGDISKKGSTAYPTWRKQAELIEDIQRIGVIHELRLLDFALQPVPPNTPCSLTFEGSTQAAAAGEDGVVRFAAPKNVGRCHVEWDIPGKDGGAIRASREDVILVLQSDDDVGDRLDNLGHEETTLEEQVLAYQAEMGRDQSGLVDDIADEVINWHDGGSRPPVGSASVSLASTTRGAPAQAKSDLTRKKTVGPRVIAMPHIPRGKSFAQAKRLVPAFSYERDKKGRLYRMDVPAGCHSAITFKGAGGMIVTSNNPNAVSSDDPKLFIANDPPEPTRTVFFFAKRDIGSKTEVALFEERDAGNIRNLFQVQVKPHPGRRPMLLNLHGGALCCNALNLGGAGGPAVPPYDLDVNKPIDASSSFADLVDLILDELGKRTLVHLVINAHGSINPSTGVGFIRCGTGIHRDPGLLAPLDKLHGKFDYVWLASCAVARDNQLVGEIARRTGAWVTAVRNDTPAVKYPKGHIEYFQNVTPVHWDGRALNPSSAIPLPSSRDEFFGQARHASTVDLDRDLHFNIVTEPQGPSF